MPLRVLSVIFICVFCITLFAHADGDRILAKDIETMIQLIQSGKILEAVERRVGKLK